jgi:hypothetical protein
MALTKKKILKDYNKLKKIAIQSAILNKINKSIAFTKAAAKIAYQFNFQYCDDELEENIYKIGQSIIKENNILFTGNPNKVVFYDSFSIDNRGLTQQYLRAIFSWNCEILYITSHNKIGEQILSELNNYDKSQIIIMNDKSFSENALKTLNSIILFEPGKVFLHFSPWDILGFVIWSQIKNVERFFINLTDHAFWLGKSCIDYSLEFRGYGQHISQFERNIPKEKLLYQPYYPILSAKKFKGFPEKTKNKVIAFAGSAYYKIYGDNFKLLNMIKEVLFSNDNLVFLYAGSGNDIPIKKFISKNKLENKFILLGNRDDISEVIRHIDIYVNTYPMIGGLMSQYAAIMNKPIIGYTNIELYSYNDTEDLLGIQQKGLLVKTTPSDFLSYFNDLINDQEKRKENICYTRNSVLDEQGFNKSLLKTISEKKNIWFRNNHIRIEQNKIFDSYFDIEINYEKHYSRAMFSALKYRMFYFKPIDLIQFLLIHSCRKIFTKSNSFINYLKILN